MSAILEALARNASRRPASIALVGAAQSINWRDLHGQVLRTAERLVQAGARRTGLLADNGPGWVIADLAAIAAKICLVPLPPFFSTAQQAHALRRAGADSLLIDPRLNPPVDGLPLRALDGLDLLGLAGEGDAVSLPLGTRKITFTSGTTGEPKGVCLGHAEIERVAEGLCVASGAKSDDVHLGLMPLATLLENIGGIYAPILAGATIVQRPLADVGLIGASRLDAPRLAAALDGARASTAILVPQLLLGLVGAIAGGAPTPRALRFLAVGGAPIASSLLERALGAGLPVYEGYGLSECASVVALNRPGATRVGTVGRPLRHLRVTIDDSGEIVVAGNGFRGYVGESLRDASEPLATGDLGAFDADGYLRITGRRKNLFITAFGRNVAPEWIESELCAHPAIAQAAVFGEARPWNAAVIVPRGPAAAVDRALESINAGLPDYARVRRWISATEPFSQVNEQITPNGRVRRERIAGAYQTCLHALYEDESR